MNIKSTSQNSPYAGYVQELVEKLSNPIHIRLIKAYQSDNPVQTMEAELGKILMEILQRED